MEDMDHTKQKVLHHGICTDSTGACTRSYVHAKGLDWAFTQWYSMKVMPGGGGASRSTDLAGKCSVIYQSHPVDEGFCGSCGNVLAFRSVEPVLGNCPKCSRQYNDGDLSQSFCSRCGDPIEITGQNRTEAERHRSLVELFELLPKLRENGYVSTHYRSE